MNIAVDARKSTVKKLNLFRGEYCVSRDPNLLVSTILGSCVAACIRDPVLGIGGINHFLLPGEMEDSKRSRDERIGVHLMELLINGLLREGAHKERLEAKLFGGGRTLNRLTDFGAQNAAFAKGFLEAEGIALKGGSVGGFHGRRIQYWPASGRVLQGLIGLEETTQLPSRPSVAVSPQAGELVLF